MAGLSGQKVPAFANDYPDNSPKGMIVDLHVREDGLFCKPVFTYEGSELVETGRPCVPFSAYWSARQIGEQPGDDGNTLKIFRPDQLKSAGLTNHPNLPVHLLNEAQPQTQLQPIVKKQIVIDFLAAQGISLSADAGDEQIGAALKQFGASVAAANTELANERKFHIDTLLDAALAAFTASPLAQRPEVVRGASFEDGISANESAALAQLSPTLKTRGITVNHGGRKAEMANASERRDALDVLIKK